MKENQKVDRHLAGHGSILFALLWKIIRLYSLTIKKK